MSTLARRLLAIDTALADAAIPHAFGGAIALAYCTGEPRGTIDLDINIFLPHAAPDAALEALPAGITVTPTNRKEVLDRGQTRAWWEETPIDLFFDSHPFHDVAHGRVRSVPFADTTIPVLDCTSLAVFKAFSNRTRDWADLEAMSEAGQFEVNAVGGFLADLLGKDDPRLDRLRHLG
jgi:hypothetical protein